MGFLFRFGAVFGYLVLMAGCAYGQDSLLDQLEEEASPIEDLTYGTFKGTRLINGHTIETRGAGNLDFIISHRFGRVNSGGYNFFGLDDANVRLGLAYSFTDNLTVGVGRNSFQKVYDGFVKYKLLKQQSGKKQMPVTMTWYSNMSVNTFKRPELPMSFERRLAYANQLLIARKFSEGLFLQLMPSYVHQNLVPSAMDRNDLFALGVGGRLKLTPRTSLNMEYYYRVNPYEDDGFYNSLAIGFDIETGGHVFQLQLTNAQSMTETGFIPATTGNFWDGDIHFGFNISRSFQLKEKGKKW
ncbi:hypothetical protein DN752_20845 [Echinicola strongylocentroti]|uniref:DUF5777 domain-containing protein n=1 Tax=Echinicola strongylocentroti TaxID=1795355 RepID=A0A2Z4IMQ2_9BACT|nr:DUF5777 family beta-barrel protein [Echinicola strongylocentroti]AWW32391.1 hypothetical protein DN752_20845 [Echinicola strongylocentroti]